MLKKKLKHLLLKLKLTHQQKLKAQSNFNKSLFNSEATFGSSLLLFKGIFNMKIEDSFRIGSIIKTKGLKGELQLHVDFDNLGDIDFDALFIDMSGKLVPYFVESIKYHPNNTAYLFLEDLDTIEKASKLVKKDVYLPNKLKPKKKKGDFTLMDLLGFMVIDENEGELGKITDIQELPQQYIATVTYKDCEVLFPLNEEIIKGIDVVKSIVLVDLPEGLLDIYLD
ncbi:MAG: ribosome maturation factor RimM [Mucilaginibacter sp.]